MTILEIMMITIGLIAVFASFRISEKKDEKYGGQDTELIQSLLEQEQEKLVDQIEKKFDAIKSEMIDKADAELSKISNEKIIALSEYADQIFDKMEKNHAEEVFLYDMLNEKQQEVKKMVQEVDVVKADLHDAVAKQYQKLTKQMELAETKRKEWDIELLQKKKTSNSRPKRENPVHRTPNTEPLPSANAEKSIISKEKQQKAKSSKASVYDEEIARIEEAERRERKKKEKEALQPLDTTNHNDEILSLYKKGRSVLEISKMLSLGQGEVKFVIDLYEARQA